MLIFFYIIIGIIIGIVLLVMLAFMSARKDEREFTKGKRLMPKELYGEGDEWKSTLRVQTLPADKRKLSLKEQLANALAEEKYEEAARIRDEINKDNKNISKNGQV